MIRVYCYCRRSEILALCRPKSFLLLFKSKGRFKETLFLNTELSAEIEFLPLFFVAHFELSKRSRAESRKFKLLRNCCPARKKNTKLLNEV